MEWSLRAAIFALPRTNFSGAANIIRLVGDFHNCGALAQLAKCTQSVVRPGTWPVFDTTQQEH